MEGDILKSSLQIIYITNILALRLWGYDLADTNAS